MSFAGPPHAIRQRIFNKVDLAAAFRTHDADHFAFSTSKLTFFNAQKSSGVEWEGLNVGTLEGEELALPDAEPFALVHFPTFARIARNGFIAASATTSRSAV